MRGCKPLWLGLNLGSLFQVLALGSVLVGPMLWAQTNPRPKAVMPPSSVSKPLPEAEESPQVNLLNEAALRPLLIRNQGQTSYCFAVAATALFDVWNVRNSSEPSAYRRSSSLEVAKVKSLTPTGGGDVRQAVDYIFARGACQDSKPEEVECFPKTGSLENALGSGCTRNRAKVQAQAVVLSRSNSKKIDTEFEESFLKIIDEELNKGMPVAVSLCESHLSSADVESRCSPKSPLLHASLVVGRECNQAKRGFGCFYLVHLFNGKSLDDVEISLKFRSRDRQEFGTGSIWMSDEELKRAALDVYRLKPSSIKR